MIRKSLAFLLVGFVIVIAGDAQTPAPGAKGETQAFSLFFDNDGGYLGVETEEITKDNFAKYGLREVRGVGVEKVIEGSPAEKAGLQTGDVIVRFNNEEITSIRKLTRLLGEVAPDHQAKLTVLRSGGEREMTATLGKRPTPGFQEGSFGSLPRVQRAPFPPNVQMRPFPPMQSIPSPGTPDQPFNWMVGSTRRIGVGVSTLSKQLSEHFGVQSGVLINEVRVDSPAAKAGLKAGDIIVEADGKELKDEGDLVRAINQDKAGDVTLTIVRDRNRQTVRVTPEETNFTPNSYYIVPTVPGGPPKPLPATIPWGRGGSGQSIFPLLFPRAQ